MKSLLQVLMTVSFLLLCQDCSSPTSISAPTPKIKASNPNPTFNQDIGPMVQAKCMQCHSDGQVEAKVQFNTYDKAKTWATAMAAEVNSHTMPPWPLAAGDSKYAPGNQMPTFQDTRGLTDDEIALINLWIANGKPQGTGGDMTFSAPATTTLTGPSVVKLTMPQKFTPNPGSGLLDQYRCFILDPISADSDTWITAYQMLPDQTAETHHALVYVPMSDADLAAAKALETVPGQGYDCWTGPGDKVKAAILSIWAPGTGVVRYPNNTAIKVAKGMNLIVQVHYNIRNGATADQSSIAVEAQTNATGLTQAFWFASGIGQPTNVTIPLNQADAQFPATQTVTSILGTPSITVYGIYPHEHRLGTRLHVEMQKGAQKLPMFDDYPWDFNWQDGYFFSNPITLAGTDSFITTCHYDTTLDAKGNDITGVHRDQPVPFGDFTTDEMCYAFMFGAVTP